jgi:general L-amino acid transport system substrate-binding protein
MKKSVFLGTLAVAGLAAGIASGQTLAEVQERGIAELRRDHRSDRFRSSGRQRRVGRLRRRRVPRRRRRRLGDPMAVEFVPTTGQTRFTALASGEVDMLARNTTWTFSRDVDLAFEFVA